MTTCPTCRGAGYLDGGKPATAETGKRCFDCGGKLVIGDHDALSLAQHVACVNRDHTRESQYPGRYSGRDAKRDRALEMEREARWEALG